MSETTRKFSVFVLISFVVFFGLIGFIIIGGGGGSETSNNTATPTSNNSASDVNVWSQNRPGFLSGPINETKLVETVRQYSNKYYTESHTRRIEVDTIESVVRRDIQSNSNRTYINISGKQPDFTRSYYQDGETYVRSISAAVANPRYARLPDEINTLQQQQRLSLLNKQLNAVELKYNGETTQGGEKLYVLDSYLINNRSVFWRLYGTNTDRYEIQIGVRDDGFIKNASVLAEFDYNNNSYEVSDEYHFSRKDSSTIQRPSWVRSIDGELPRFSAKYSEDERYVILENEGPETVPSESRIFLELPDRDIEFRMTEAVEPGEKVYFVKNGSRYRYEYDVPEGGINGQISSDSSLAIYEYPNILIGKTLIGGNSD
jgi:hypothetical protein